MNTPTRKNSIKLTLAQLKQLRDAIRASGLSCDMYSQDYVLNTPIAHCYSGKKTLYLCMYNANARIPTAEEIEALTPKW